MTTRPSKTAAARAEAERKPVEFTFDGELYVIAPTKEWDLDALEALEEDKVVTAVRLILGAGQWSRFRSKPRTVGDMEELFAEAQRAGGVEGN